MTRTASLLLALTLAALPVLARADQAQPDSLGAGWQPRPSDAREAVREGRHVPLGLVIDRIRMTNPGRELDAGLEAGLDGRAVYRVRWAAANGRRLDYIVDAQTGQILRIEGR